MRDGITKTHQVIEATDSVADATIAAFIRLAMTFSRPLLISGLGRVPAEGIGVAG